MIAKATCSILAGEHEMFAEGCEQNMVGQDYDGWEITQAERVNDYEIKLTLKGDVGVGPAMVRHASLTGRRPVKGLYPQL